MCIWRSLKQAVRGDGNVAVLKLVVWRKVVKNVRKCSDNNCWKKDLYRAGDQTKGTHTMRCRQKLAMALLHMVCYVTCSE